METITIKVLEQVEILKEIKLPYYSRFGKNLFYKVFSKDHCLGLMHPNDDNDLFIGIIMKLPSSAFGKDNIEITEEEFYKAYEKINDIINGIVI